MLIETLKLSRISKGKRIFKGILYSPKTSRNLSMLFAAVTRLDEGLYLKHSSYYWWKKILICLVGTQIQTVSIIKEQLTCTGKS